VPTVPRPYVDRAVAARRVWDSTYPGSSVTLGRHCGHDLRLRTVASSSSVRPTALTWVLLVLGVVCVVVALVYWTQPANSLPTFFPGANAANAAKHTKHGIAALGVGIVLFIGAWMTTGSKKDSTPTS